MPPQICYLRSRFDECQAKRLTHGTLRNTSSWMLSNTVIDSTSGASRCESEASHMAWGDSIAKLQRLELQKLDSSYCKELVCIKNMEVRLVILRRPEDWLLTSL